MGYVSRAVVDATFNRPVKFTALGQIELKGAPDPMEPFAARRRSS